MIKKVSNLLALIVLFALPILAIGAPLSDAESAYLADKKSIQMCTDPDWMPLEMVKDGQHIGIAADFMPLFEAYLGIPIKLVLTKNWLETLQFAKNRECDILSMAMSTPERLEYLDFTKPYISIPLVLATDYNQQFISDVTTIRDKQLGIVEGYAFGDLLRTKYPLMQIVDVKSVDDGLSQVAEGKIYGFIGALATVGYAIQKDFTNELKITGKFDSKWELGIGVRNDAPQLLSAFDKAINSVSYLDRY